MTELEYFKGDEFISGVWRSKYGQENEKSPEDMFRREAREFARVRFKKDQSKTQLEWEEYFFDLFNNTEHSIPQGRVMAGLGVKDSYRSLSNCLRLPPPKDSYSSIMRTDTMLVSAAKRGCGYGVGLSNIRPYGSNTTNAAKTSTGVIGFGERYSNSTKEVGQEGRRGAFLGDLDIRHPDAPEWAIVKLDKTKYTGANISFKMWNDFMEAMLKDQDYILRFPCDIGFNDPKEFYDNLEYNNLTKSEIFNNQYFKKIKAKELWDKAIHTVWADGCPGLQFWDRMVNYDPSSVYQKYAIDGTNACGEQPMTIYDTCRLLVQALIRSIKNPFTERAELDEEYLYWASYTLMEIGDDLIDLEIEYIQRIIDKIKSDPEDEKTKAIELDLWINVLDMAKSGRRIGCGITALADMLAAINLKYDTQEALDFTEKVMRIKFKAELDAAMDLAEKYGTFEGWDPNLEKDGNDWYRFVEKEFPEEWSRMQKVGRRFVNWSTIAPVGTTSIITKAIKNYNVSSGCEPQFGLWFFRNRKVDSKNDSYDFIDEVGIKWKQYPVIMGAFKDYLEIKYNITDINNLKQEDLQKYYEESPYYKALADEISYENRVKMQAILQKYTTSAISSTINLPKDVKEEVISDIYIKAWQNGLKGITVYRDGSKGGVLVKEAISKTDKFGYTDARKRPKELQGDYYSVTSKGKKYGVVVGLLDENPYEVFAFEDGDYKDTKGKVIKVKKGVYKFTSDNFTLENLTLNTEHSDEKLLTRWVSLLLRHGANPKYIAEQVERSEVSVVSFAKVISRILKKYIKDEETEEKCPECSNGKIVRKEGCLQCNSCGYSKC